MARRKQDAPLIPTNSLVASAVRYPGKAARIYQPNQDWQRECYRHFGICGEARFAATFFGKAIGKATLGISVKSKDGPVVATSGAAYDTLTSIFNGASGQAQMLESIGVHLTIAGECYIVGRQVVTAAESGAPEERVDVWEVLSPLEISSTGGKWQIDYGTNITKVDLSDDDTIIRVWTASPARRMEADSPFRSLLPILNEIEWLTRHIFAQTTSRLTGAGILVLPQSVSFPSPPEGSELKNEASNFMQILGEAMMTPLDDPSNPASVVPIVVQVPDEVVDKITHLKFWTDLDGEALNLRSEAIRRFALGMDLPVEQILGMGGASGSGGGRSNGVSHWGAWQIEESTIKMHIEPMLETISNAFTIGLIRPIGDVEDYVSYSTTALRLRPDRSKEAIELYDRGMLSQAKTLAETGFIPDDMPDPDELKQWFLRKIASGSATPEQVGEALKILTGVDLPTPDTGAQQMPNESRPDPSLEDHPTKPRTPDEAALYAACDALVFRALERVGNRLRQLGTKPVGVSAWETHLHCASKMDGPALLVDAFSCADQVLQGLTDNPQGVVDRLHAYTSRTVVTRAQHSKAEMIRWLVPLEGVA